ncbi:polyprenyl synthetase family protein [Lentzea sp. NPDC051838]|uniref:polyprenyl synthetase family protein n=1 Tax=Lentzea sp. NPDC051838 TaxID=3154849 RepID=UPI00342581D4
MTELRAFVFSGGKRLRPLLCLLGWQGALSTSPPDELAAAAASFELFHTAALIHDDIMDASDTRRGRPAVHRAVGVPAAIIAGDMCWAWSDEMLRTSGLPERNLTAALPTIATMRTELMAGQYLDVSPPGLEEARLAHAHRVNLLKTSRYTVVRPLQVGGILAGASPELLEVYQQAGELLGSAFQLRDDLLGVYGSPCETGKPNGDDLRNGKRTVLVALALRGADDRQTHLLRTHLGDPQLTDDEAAALRDVITDTGARAETEQLIADQTSAAIALLTNAPMQPHGRTELIDLATRLAFRSV